MSEKKTITTLIPSKPNAPGYYTSKDMGAGNMEYRCVICGPILDPEPWYGLVELLETAKEGDKIRLDFLSPGGYVATGCVLANAILHSKATVEGFAISMTASIAAMMLCACDVIKVGPMATVMFHGASGGQFGKTIDNEEEARQMNTYFQHLLRSVGKRLLTTEEIDEIIENRIDKYKSAKEILAILEGQKHEVSAVDIQEAEVTDTTGETEDLEGIEEPDEVEETPETIDDESSVEEGGDSDE